MAQQPTTPLDNANEANEARADIAIKLERLAQRVRATTTMDMDDLAEAYTQAVKCSGNLRDILNMQPS